MGAYATATARIADLDLSPGTVTVAYVSVGTMEMLGQPTLLGRGVLPDDNAADAPGVVLLGHRLWVGRYAAEPTIIGKSVMLDNKSATVIGVMPEGFEFPYRHEAWMPLGMLEGLRSQTRAVRPLGVIGRLAPGVSREDARRELVSIADRLGDSDSAGTARVEPLVVPFGEQQVGRFGDQEPPLAILATAVFVLLIACANIISLLLSRAVGRAREMAIRRAVGASRARLLVQLLVESALLCAAGTAFGLWLSTFGVQFIADSFGRNVPYWMQFSLDLRVLGVVAVVSALCTITFGIAPLLSLPGAGPLSNDSGATAGAPRVRRWTQALLTGELALTIVLLTGAGLVVRSFLHVYTADRVVDTAQALTMELELPESKYDTSTARRALFNLLNDRLQERTGELIATVASTRPFVGAASTKFWLDGDAADAATARSASTVFVGRRYFDAVRVRLLRGRAFEPGDDQAGMSSAIVNQRFAAAYFPNADPIGQRFRLETSAYGGNSPWTVIVGVSPDIRQAVASGVRPVVYLPLSAYDRGSAAILIAHHSTDAAAAARVRQEVAAVDPDVVLDNVRPLKDLRSDSRLQHMLMATILAAFAGVALVLSVIGLYALTAYSVLQRRHEIGVRLALGAQTRQVVWLFVRRAALPLGAGLVLGSAGALAVGALIRGLLIQTSASDPLTFGGVAALMIVVVLTACALPARRAALTNPVTILRRQ